MQLHGPSFRQSRLEKALCIVLAVLEGDDPQYTLFSVAGVDHPSPMAERPSF